MIYRYNVSEHLRMSSIKFIIILLESVQIMQKIIVLFFKLYVWHRRAYIVLSNISGKDDVSD